MKLLLSYNIESSKKESNGFSISKNIVIIVQKNLRDPSFNNFVRCFSFLRRDLTCVGFRMSFKYIKNLVLPIFEEALIGKH